MLAAQHACNANLPTQWPCVLSASTGSCHSRRLLKFHANGVHKMLHRRPPLLTSTVCRLHNSSLPAACQVCLYSVTLLAASFMPLPPPPDTAFTSRGKPTASASDSSLQAAVEAAVQQQTQLQPHHKHTRGNTSPHKGEAPGSIHGCCWTCVNACNVSPSPFCLSRLYCCPLS